MQGSCYETGLSGKASSKVNLRSGEMNEQAHTDSLRQCIKIKAYLTSFLGSETLAWKPLPEA